MRFVRISNLLAIAAPLAFLWAGKALREVECVERCSVLSGSAFASAVSLSATVAAAAAFLSFTPLRGLSSTVVALCAVGLLVGYHLALVTAVGLGDGVLTPTLALSIPVLGWLAVGAQRRSDRFTSAHRDDRCEVASQLARFPRNQHDG